MNSISLCVFYVCEIVLAVLAHNDFQSVDITPREAIRRIGDPLSVLCKVPYSIDSCSLSAELSLTDTSIMRIDTTVYRLIPNITQGDIVYEGRGLRAGECGALIKNIRVEWNGNITCIVPAPTGNSDELHGTMTLIVARAPGDPILYTSKQLTFKDGDQLMAQCFVPNGRPAAKITWFLGSEELLAGKHQLIIISKPGSDLQTISKNVSRTLTDEDDTKMLVCKAEHEALSQPKELRRQLIVQYPPKRLESGPITIFGLKLGAEGRLNVTVRANPKPTAEWAAADEILIAPRRTDDGKFTALEPLLLGKGYYNITLIVASITKDDVVRTYYLHVENSLGRVAFPVRISISGESNIVPIVASISCVAVTLAVIIIVLWKCPRVKCNQSGTPQPPINEPSDPFYLNMLFRRECDREIADIEQHEYAEVGERSYEEVRNQTS